MSTQTSLKRRSFLASGALLALPSMPALAQSGRAANWPTRPIKLVVSGPAGSGGDIFARLLTTPLQEALKQSVLVDNKAGANGLIGNDAVAKAAPDGHTFLLTASSSIALNPVLQAKMPYDTLKDLVPVSQIGLSGFLLVAHPSTGFKTLADMVQYVRANPGKLSYGTWGNGSSGHLAMESLKAHYKLDLPHVPYKGVAGLVTDLLGNQIGVGFVDIASPVPHVRAGRLAALAITGSSRGPALPEVPRLTEQGFKFDADGWYGVFAPSGTPTEIVRRMNEELNKILATEDMRQQFISKNMPAPPIKSADQFAATVASDVALWQGLAKPLNLKQD